MSGLGLDAQRAQLASYLSKSDRVLSEYIEVESGRSNERPQLGKAIRQAKAQNAILLIAKIDRLSRNVSFVSNLLESGVEVAAADMPNADRFQFHIMAAVAEYEAAAISKRTKQALAAAKERGRKLGWSNPSRRSEMLAASKKGAAKNASKADQHARALLPIVEQMSKNGASLASISSCLNERGVRTALDKRWHPATVRNLLLRGQRIRDVKAC